ncbi:hypothetical protein OUHCRE7_45420 [Enterobacter hormaechei subsp. hoffmannii]
MVVFLRPLGLRLVAIPMPGLTGIIVARVVLVSRIVAMSFCEPRSWD